MTPCTSSGSFLGRSAAVARVLELVERAAAFDVSILLTGETGTGKSHLARLIHDLSPRRTGPFVSVNCAGVPEALFESELFGHSRGAFTGAVAARVGLFEEAAAGTLFLDEVGELPLTQQAKLLTVLEERRVRPVGTSRDRPVDARVVTATSRDLPAALAAGAFRPDLYHRIALLRCEIPPLRARADDVVLLARHLLAELTRKYRRPGVTVSEAGWALLVAHRWPGNVRELAHVLEASLILTPGSTIGPRELLPHLSTSPSPSAVAGNPEPGPEPIGTLAEETAAPSPATAPFGGPRAAKPPARYSFFGREGEEMESIRAAMTRCRGNRTRAAAELGMARNTLREKLRKYGLDGRRAPAELSETIP